MIDAAELQAYLNHPAELTTMVGLLEQAAVTIVETWQGIRYPAAGTQVEFIRVGRPIPNSNLGVLSTVWTIGNKDLFLTLNPTADPTEVLERADVGEVGTPITAAQSDGWVRRGTVLVRKGTVWKEGFEYQVTYAGGYAAGTEPDNVRQAVKSVTLVLYNRRGAEVSMTDLARTDNDEINDLLTQMAIPKRLVFA